ncbi:MAG: Fe(3+) ABC transporter substrate-binding protein, partial [Oxalobacteraceae bacterium]
VQTAVVKNPALDALGKFKMENVSVGAMGKNQATAQKILDRAGYK